MCGCRLGLGHRSHFGNCILLSVVINASPLINSHNIQHVFHIGTVYIYIYSHFCSGLNWFAASVKKVLMLIPLGKAYCEAHFSFIQRRAPVSLILLLLNIGSPAGHNNAFYTTQWHSVHFNLIHLETFWFVQLSWDNLTVLNHLLLERDFLEKVSGS